MGELQHGQNELETVTSFCVPTYSRIPSNYLNHMIYSKVNFVSYMSLGCLDTKTKCEMLILEMA